MKIEELRIGNKVSFINKYGENQVDTVSTINYDTSLCTHAFEFRHDIEDITPIPLTEDWLFKLGFKLSYIAPDKYNAPDDNQHYHIIKYDDKYIFRGLGASVVEVKTVHHLQNLYFALTGKELTL